MKQTPTFTECRQIQPKHRSTLRQLYQAGEAPNVLLVPPLRDLHAAWDGDTPLAAITADNSDRDTNRFIRLKHVAYRNQHVFRGLLERVLHKIGREATHTTKVSLQVKQDHNQDNLNIFKALGFNPYHETTVYTLPLLPFQKPSYANWSLHLATQDTRSTWLAYRNDHAYLFADFSPMTSEDLKEQELQQSGFYTLKLNGQTAGIMHCRINNGRLEIYEFHVMGNDEMMQEAVSFIQQVFYLKFKSLEAAHVTLTSLQPDLRYALLKQGAPKTQPSHFTMLKEINYSPLFSL